MSLQNVFLKQRVVTAGWPSAKEQCWDYVCNCLPQSLSHLVCVWSMRVSVCHTRARRQQRTISGISQVPFAFCSAFSVLRIEPRPSREQSKHLPMGPAPAPPTYFLEPSSVAWNLPSGISWLVPEPQGSACLYLPCTGITSMPPCPAFFSCALDIKLGS